MCRRTGLVCLFSLVLFADVLGCGGGKGERSIVVGADDKGAGGSGTTMGSTGTGSSGPTGSTATGGTGGTEVAIDTTQKAKSRCEQENPPPECQLRPSGPACGDGQINQNGEECDDGNGLPGDGCSGVCTKEAYFDCPTPGQPCVSTIVCGDGKLGPGEACDDGNTNDGDGCTAKCNLVEAGWACRTAGQKCTKMRVCGDGKVDESEGCDDGNANAGDGCDPKCRIELGYKCADTPSKCTRTACGDGKREGAESCDDGNRVPFDGCNSDCRVEPDCSAGACKAICGDGIVFSSEECDDGNLRDGDGCSSECKIETGYECNNDAGNCIMVGETCTMPIPAVFRDFAKNDSKGGHPDFQPPDYNEDGPITGLVKDTLDADGKPVWSGATTGFIHSTDSFRQWYRESAPTNATFVKPIVLWDNGKGGFVNRYGENGERWVQYAHASPCINGTNDCSDTLLCVVGAGQVCLPKGIDGKGKASIVDVAHEWDGNPFFFPIDPPLTGLISDTRFAAKVTPPYNGPDKYDDECALRNCGGKEVLHNFHFTTEVKYWFKFDPKVAAKFEFTGDDDVWVFVNNKLALDLGGWHIAWSGSITLDANAGKKFGLTEGSVYAISVFQAERMTDASTFQLTLTGFNLAPSDCTTNCGDGEVAPGEECDDGSAKNQGGYNQCSPACTLGPRCGDGVKQEQYGEICDNGPTGNDGAYGGCSPECQKGPYCGDGIVQPDHEQCDDGVNDGSYGKCAPGCVLGPRCGDGVLAATYEECDDGNNNNYDTCSSGCKVESMPAQ